MGASLEFISALMLYIWERQSAVSGNIWKHPEEECVEARELGFLKLRGFSTDSCGLLLLATGSFQRLAFPFPSSFLGLPLH